MRRSRFFCENCSFEVRPNAKVCPSCGRFFQAVRCPACNHTGKAEEFLHGCPVCGYAGRTDGFEAVDYGRPARRAPPGVPSWVWPLAGAIVGFLFLVLVIIYLTM